MKFNKIYLLVLISILTAMVSAQEKTVEFQFSVLDDNGNFASGLKTNDIQILQDKKALQFDLLELKAESPLEIVLMIDASASQERMLPFEKKIAEMFIDNVLTKEKDKIAIIKFTGEISLIQDFTNDLSKAKNQLKLVETVIVKPPFPSTSDQRVKGATSIWDSIINTISAFTKTKSIDSRQTVILISDGVNTFGNSKFKEVIDSSLKNQIPVFAIGIGDDFFEGVDKNTLKKLTEETNGILILPDENDKDLDKQIKILESGLHPNYKATFTVNQVKSKNSLQELKIKIVNPELRKKKLQIIQPKGFILTEK